MTAEPRAGDESGSDATHFPLDARTTFRGPEGIALRLHATELTIVADDAGGVRSCDLRFGVAAGDLAASGLLERATDAPAVPEVPDDAEVEVTARLRDGASTTANAATLRRELRRGGLLAALDRWDVVDVRLAGGGPWN